MTYFDWYQHLQTCPLVLAGPILRHAAFETVSVWVALKRPCTVELTIYTTANRGARVGEPQMAGQATTRQVGRSLHMAVITAHPLTASLQSDRLYAYDLRFIPQDGHPPQSLLQALGAGKTISYFDHQRPTFALSPSQLNHLQIAHGSCRKAHGEGLDTLPILDQLIEKTAASPYHRPHQLFHTGDQIYADDVADVMLAMCSPFGNALLGWTEALPLGPQASDVDYYSPEALLPGRRAETATRTAGFTGGLREKRPRVTSHLFSLGEFCALYLMMWSPNCWPASLPLPHDGLDRSEVRRWQRDTQSLQQFRATLWRVQRALANVASYMIFDDHDVSDDWNLNQAWCVRALSKPLGRWTVQNALHAYALFQGWGNCPAQFEWGPAHALLKATEDWTQSEGQDLEVHEAIARYVGMPAYDPETGLPHFIEVGEGLQCLERSPEAIDWYTVIESHSHTVILLDTRLYRGFLIDESPITPTQLLSPAAFEEQLARPLARCTSKVTFVVAPTNLFHLKVIDWVHHRQLNNHRVFNTDVGDAWTVNMEALAKLITTLAEHRQQVVILSGDIHYSSSVRLTYQPAAAAHRPSLLVQLTCSSFKNEEAQTRLVQSRLKSWLLPERDRHWAGWNHPKTMTEIKRSPLHRLLESTPDLASRQQPDWWCHLEWLSRQQVRQVSCKVDDFRNPDLNVGAWRRWALSLWQRLLRSRWVQNGAEVVGVNNMGMVSFPEGDDPPTAIAHDLYWFSPWNPTELLCSRYGTDLQPSESDRDTEDPILETIARS